MSNPETTPTKLQRSGLPLAFLFLWGMGLATGGAIEASDYAAALLSGGISLIVIFGAFANG